MTGDGIKNRMSLTAMLLEIILILLRSEWRLVLLPKVTKLPLGV